MIRSITETVSQETGDVTTNLWSNMSLFTLSLVMLGIGLVWRLVDIFILRLGTSWINILPSKLFPLSIFIILFWRYRRVEIATVLGLSRVRFREHIFVGSVVGTTLIFFSLVLPSLFYSFVNPSFVIEIRILFIDTLWYQLMFFFINAVMEETLFRGALLHGINTKTNMSHAILYSSIIFGFWHIFWPIANGATGLKLLSEMFVAVVFSALVGVLFCIYYIHFSSSMSLIGPIVVHTILNFINECIKIGPVSGIQGPDIPSYDPVFMIISLVFSLFTLSGLMIVFSRYKIEDILA